jgi:hypothetical protein
MRAPHLDDNRRPRLGDPACLAQRSHHVVREEERVEASDEVEAVVVVWQILHLADTQIDARQARAGEFDQPFGSVEPECARTTLGNLAQKGANAAADVEDRIAWPELDTLERGFICRRLLVL